MTRDEVDPSRPNLPYDVLEPKMYRGSGLVRGLKVFPWKAEAPASTGAICRPGIPSPNLTVSLQNNGRSLSMTRWPRPTSDRPGYPCGRVPWALFTSMGPLQSLCRSRASGSHSLGAAILSDDQRWVPRMPATRSWPSAGLTELGATERRDARAREEKGEAW